MDAEPSSTPDGQRTTEIEQWEAHAIADLAVILFRYASEHPCPGDSRIEVELGQWAASLELSGQARLAALRLRPLRSI